jgi:hypothetical protein
MGKGVRKVLLLFGVAAAVFVLTDLSPASRAGAQEPNVWLEVPAGPVTIGDDPVSVQVMVDDVANLGAFQFELTYDESILQYVKAANADFLGSSGRPVECLDPRPTPGLVRYTCVTLGPTPPGPDGSGALAIIDLKPIGAGTTPLRLQLVTLAQPNAEQIPASSEDSSIAVATEEGIVPANPTITPAVTVAAEAPVSTPAEAVEAPASSEGSSGGGTNWTLWGSVIGVVAVLAVAAAGGAWWFLARRAA